MTTEAAAKKDTQKLQRAIIDGLEDVKAQDIQVYDTEHLSALFERVIIASGTSNRQTKALASSVRDAVREAGFSKPRIEGEENGEWIIVDCGAAVAHIMQPAIRQYYHLEEIWGDKPVRMKFGAAKPVAASAEDGAAEKKVVAPAKTLRRASAAKTAIREAEQAAKAEKAEKAERARPAARKAPARKSAAPEKAAAAPAESPAKASAGKTAAKTAAKTAVKTPVKVIGKPATKKVAAKSAGKPAAKKASARKTAARGK
jgi:ribosome-associated protein